MSNIAATAIVSPKAELAADVTVGAYAVIGDNVQIGAGTWVGFSAMTLGMFMAVLDIQIVVTSLPEISEALVIAPDKMSWVQTAYLIAEVIAIPLTGLLTRALSLRWLFVSGLCLFILASAACAASSGSLGAAKRSNARRSSCASSR